MTIKSQTGPVRGVEPLVAVAARLTRHKWVQAKKGHDGLGAWQHARAGSR